jgi:hypothetical protein
MWRRSSGKRTEEEAGLGKGNVGLHCPIAEAPRQQEVPRHGEVQKRTSPYTLGTKIVKMGLWY